MLVPLLKIVRRMQQTYESRRLPAALLLLCSGNASDASDADSRRFEDCLFRCTLAGNIAGDGERRMENGIADFAAGGPNIAHCGHLRLHSRAQAFDVCVVYSLAYDHGSTSRAGDTEE
jgi:hypothetical protein